MIGDRVFLLEERTSEWPLVGVDLEIPAFEHMPEMDDGRINCEQLQVIRAVATFSSCCTSAEIRKGALLAAHHLMQRSGDRSLAGVCAEPQLSGCAAGAANSVAFPRHLFALSKADVIASVQ